MMDHACALAPGGKYTHLPENCLNNFVLSPHPSPPCGFGFGPSLAQSLASVFVDLCARCGLWAVGSLRVPVWCVVCALPLSPTFPPSPVGRS
jgi:hypothetical protein